jgi:hypothetical protein
MHAQMHHAWARTTSAEQGQGTVEYVGLMMLIAAIIGIVATAGKGVEGKGVADAVADKLKDTVNSVAAK